MLQVVHWEANPYKVFVNNVMVGIVYPGAANSLFVDVADGTRQLKAEQHSGYVLTPTVYNATVGVPQCVTTTWQFP
jgi:hypothetical protein